jgi:hypothetical protein
MPLNSQFMIWCVLMWSVPVLAQDSTPVPIQVSLIQLIATPEKFDGKLVQVRGFLQMGREGDLIFLDKSSCDNVVPMNAIWIHRSEQMGKDKLKLNRKYVEVLGVFRVGFKEQLSIPSNGISDAKRVQAWSDPDNPLDQRIRQMPGVSAGP